MTDSGSRLLSHFLNSMQFQPKSQTGVSLALIGSLTLPGPEVAGVGGRERRGVQCSDSPCLGPMLTLRGAEGVSSAPSQGRRR